MPTLTIERAQATGTVSCILTASDSEPNGSVCVLSPMEEESLARNTRVAEEKVVAGKMVNGELLAVGHRRSENGERSREERVTGSGRERQGEVTENRIVLRASHHVKPFGGHVRVRDFEGGREPPQGEEREMEGGGRQPPQGREHEMEGGSRAWHTSNEEKHRQVRILEIEDGRQPPQGEERGIEGGNDSSPGHVRIRELEGDHVNFGHAACDHKKKKGKCDWGDENHHVSGGNKSDWGEDSHHGCGLHHQKRIRELTEDRRLLLGGSGKRLNELGQGGRRGGLRRLPVAMSSLRSLRSVAMVEDRVMASPLPPHLPWRESYFSDAVSVRSLASLGMGSTDGRRVTIRRVPTSPSELFNIVHPATPTEDGLSMASSSLFDPLEAHANYRLPRRHQWANKMQFVLACVGYSVGLGNLWRFPYLCYKSGGGVFLVPYFIIFVICGIPLFYMELAIGQFTRRGPIGALGKLCPLFKGAGLASVVISFIMSTYYNVIIAYTLYYLFSAFRSNIPWYSCDNRWNTKSCWNPDRTLFNETKPNISRTPSEEFYVNKVLNMSDGIEHPGQMRWELAACLIFAWVLVYFSIWKSIKSSGKVLYFTATFPYLLILIFLVRALTLEGADLGLRYFFKPCWELLGDAKVWVNAAAQNFNSIGIAYGSVISFSSYNRFHNSILSDALAVSCINAVTSVLVGICTFATIGNIAKEQGRVIEDVIADGPGLIFVVYPQALSKMPASQLWGGMFFFMLLCLGLNSQFAIVEVVVTSIQDGFPNWIKRKLLCHEMLVLVVVVVSCLFGLPNVTQGGIYFFQLVDHFASSLSIMYLAFFEMIAISWIYGANRLAKNVQEMTGKYPSPYFTFCWWFAAPVLIMAVWVFSLIDYEPPTYDNGTYTYPLWAEALGWFIASLSLACIPVMAVAVVLRAQGNNLLEKIRNSVKSQLLECERCGNQKCLHSCTSNEEIREMSILLNQKMESQLEQMNS